MIDVARSIPSEVIGNNILGCQSMIFVRQSDRADVNITRNICTAIEAGIRRCRRSIRPGPIWGICEVSFGGNSGILEIPANRGVGYK